MLTQEEFVDGGGECCPNCGVNSQLKMEVGPQWLVDGTSLDCIFACESCGARWREEYKLVKYVLLGD